MTIDDLRDANGERLHSAKGFALRLRIPFKSYVTP